VESFSPDTETFTVLPVSLPADLGLGCGSVTFIVDGELILLTNRQQMARWRVEIETEFRVSAVDRQCYSYQPPLIMDAVVYISNAVGFTVEKWSVEAGGSFKS